MIQATKFGVCTTFGLTSTAILTTDSANDESQKNEYSIATTEINAASNQQEISNAFHNMWRSPLDVAIIKMSMISNRLYTILIIPVKMILAWWEPQGTNLIALSAFFLLISD